jgi:protein-L-isoaspartate(D-aspartate) O-methyltransferase
MACLLADLVLDGAGPDKLKDVLEIGTGSGYQSAILAERCRSLVSIDVKCQPSALLQLPESVALVIANGYEYDSGEQFDAVLVTFAAVRIAQAWVRQTKVGGRLVIPLDTGTGCRISVFERTDEGIELLDVVAYAPFTPGAQA